MDWDSSGQVRSDDLGGLRSEISLVESGERGRHPGPALKGGKETGADRMDRVVYNKNWGVSRLYCATFKLPNQDHDSLKKSNHVSHAFRVISKYLAVQRPKRLSSSRSPAQM